MPPTKVNGSTSCKHKHEYAKDAVTGRALPRRTDPRDYASGREGGTGADGDAGENLNVSTDPNVVTDDNRLSIFGPLCAIPDGGVERVGSREERDVWAE